jgi:PAS domain S-box-containing protein
MEIDPTLRILFVEDFPPDFELAEWVLRKDGIAYTSLKVETREDFIAALENFHPDLVISDYVLPTFDGMQALSISLERDPALPVIILTGSMNEDTAVTCMKAGASDYVIKEHITRLPLAVKNAMKQKTTRQAKEEADRALRETNQLLAAIIQASPLAINVVNREGKVTLWSPAAEKLFGWKAEEVIGQPLPPIPAQLEAETDLSLANELKGMAFTMRESKRQRKDGSLVDISLSTAPLCTPQGEVTGTMAIIADITESKKIEQALAESEERYRRLVETSPDAIGICTDGIITFANQSSAEIFGAKSIDELIGTALLNRLPAESRPEFGRRMQALDRNEEIPYIEQRLNKLSGEPIDVETYIVPFSYQGKPSIQLIARDISIRKRTEEALRRRLAEVETLHNVSAILRTANSIDEALPELLDQTLATLGCESGCIWLYQLEEGLLRPAAARGWFQEMAGIPIKPGVGLAGKVFASGQVRQSPLFMNDPWVIQHGKTIPPTDQGGVSIPIQTANETVGVLIISVTQPRQINTEEMNLLNSLAEMAGGAIHRIRLHEETVHQLQKLEALRSIDLAISSSLDLRLILNLLLEKITSQLKVDAACILLAQSPNNSLSYAAGRGFRTRGIEHARLRIGEGLAGRVALEGKPWLVPALDAEPAFARSPSFASESFAAYYGIPLIAKGIVKGVLEIFHRSPLSLESDWLSFLEMLAGQAAIAIENSQLFENQQLSNRELSIAYNATIEGWARALDLRDRETVGHSHRVTDTALRLARAMGVREEDLVHIRRGCLLHDIGKLGVPDEILLKQGPLTDEEMNIMKLHPVHAYNLLMPINYLHPAIDIPYRHHERWDGSGYPDGLKGDQIPLAAQIFAVVDEWDALTSDKPYRPAWSKETCTEYLEEQRGKHFNPLVLDKFIQLLKEMEKSY